MSPEPGQEATDVHILVVFTKPEEGREDEYNRWYSETHLPEVVATDGFVAARRYHLTAFDPPQDAEYEYLAIYEVEGDVEAAKAALTAGRTTRTPTPDAMSPDRTSIWYTAITPRLEAGSRP